MIQFTIDNFACELLALNEYKLLVLFSNSGYERVVIYF